MGYEALLVNGVDLATFGCVQLLDGIWEVSLPRGDDLTIPGLDGEIWTDKPYGAGTVDIGLILSGTTTTDFNDQYRALKILIQPGSLLTLSRHLSYTTGNEVHTANATFASGLSPTVTFLRFGKTTITFKLLDGVWYDTSTYSFSVSPGGSVTVTGVGETRTHKMTITMAPLSAITNVTTGHTLSFAKTGDDSTTISVDVMNISAHQGGNDVTQFMEWNMRYPFRIIPGAQSLLYAGAGSASGTYTPAYT